MLPVRFRKHSKDLALPDGNPYVFSVANPFEAESPRSIEDESAVSPSWAVDPNSSNDQNIAANKSEMTEDEEMAAEEAHEEEAKDITPILINVQGAEVTSMYRVILYIN